jgi:hypothetical protein
MIDKVSGKVAYAVISFGVTESQPKGAPKFNRNTDWDWSDRGFLGMGEDYYLLPWANLKYDTNLDGYRIGDA